MKRIAIAFAAAGLAMPATAASYLFDYTTTIDAINPVAHVFSGGFVTADAANAQGGYAVTALSGKRDGVDVTFFDPFDLNGSQLYYPNGPSRFDQLGLGYYIGDISYTVSFNGSLYQEFNRPVDADEQPTGLDTVAQVATLSVRPDVASAVPEPAAWTTALAGFALAGTALRRRRAMLGA